MVVTSLLPDPDAGPGLIRERPGQTVFWTTAPAAASAKAQALADMGCRIWALPSLGQGLDLAQGFTRLRRELGCHATLCEGGGRLALSLMEQGLMDEFRYVLAPSKILGDDQGVPLFAGREAQSMDQALGLRLASVGQAGQDLWLTYMPKEPR